MEAEFVVIADSGYHARVCREHLELRRKVAEDDLEFHPRAANLRPVECEDCQTIGCPHETIEPNKLKPGWICVVCGEPFVEASRLAAIRRYIMGCEERDIMPWNYDNAIERCSGLENLFLTDFKEVLPTGRRAMNCECKKFFSDPVVARIDFKCDGGTECCKDNAEDDVPTWRDDLNDLLTFAGEAQWVEETDKRLTALLERGDSVAGKDELIRLRGEEIERLRSKLNDMQKWANQAFAERDALRSKLEDETTRRQNAEFALKALPSKPGEV